MIVLPGWSSLGIFVAAALALLITPGPAVLYIVARSIDQGRRAGLISMLGVHVGTLVHVIAAAAGLSALLAASSATFGAVKFLGAAYLIYVGVRRLLAGTSATMSGGRRDRRLSRAFADGIIVNTLNPKTALFFLAFLPQFVDLSRGRVGVQILSLGLLFMALGVVTDGLYAVSAGTAAEWLRGSPRVAAGRRWISGGMYIGLGVAAAVSGARR